MQLSFARMLHSTLVCLSTRTLLVGHKHQHHAESVSSTPTGYHRWRLQRCSSGCAWVWEWDNMWYLNWNDPCIFAIFYCVYNLRYPKGYSNLYTFIEAGMLNIDVKTMPTSVANLLTRIDALQCSWYTNSCSNAIRQYVLCITLLLSRSNDTNTMVQVCMAMHHGVFKPGACLVYWNYFWKSVCLYLSLMYALTHVSKLFQWQKQPLYKKHRLNKPTKWLEYR